MSDQLSILSVGSQATGTRILVDFLLGTNTTFQSPVIRFKSFVAENRVDISLTPSATQHQSTERLYTLDREEQEWEQLLLSPHGQRTLEYLLAEAQAQVAAGEYEEGGFGLE